MTWLRGRLPRGLGHVVLPVGDEPAAVRRRRRAVVMTTFGLGSVLLGRSLATPPGSRRFYAETAALAAVWGAGAVASGPLHRGWIEGHDAVLRRPVAVPVATGAGAFAVFYGAALVARQVPFLDRAVARVLVFADEGDDGLVLATAMANGVGEELFFRGALHAASGDHPVVVSTAAYTLATATTRNPALIVAAGSMGTLWSLQRRATGGLQAPLLTHLTWSALMVRFLPPLFRHHHHPGEPS